MKMKEKLYYFPFYAADWLADCSKLTLQERGAYITLIATMYLQEDCAIYKRHIPNILGIQSKVRCAKIMDNIYPLLILLENERVTQKKIRQVKMDVEEAVERKRSSGRAGAKKRYSKSKVTSLQAIDKYSSVTTEEKARKALNQGYE